MTQSHPHLRAAIFAACPELLDLTPGCLVKVKIQDDWFKNKDDIFTIAREESSYKTDTFSLVEVGTASFDRSYFEIIGHEPRLEHVLRTLDKHTHAERYLLDCTGAIHRMPTKWVITKWDLAKPFDLQPPATLDWLESVICPEV